MSLVEYKQKHDHYGQFFDPEYYLKHWNGLDSDNDLKVEQDIKLISIKTLDSFISKIISQNAQVKLHDLSCGPTLTNMLTAARFDEVYHIDASEFLPRNRPFLINSLTNFEKKSEYYDSIVKYLNFVNGNSVNENNFSVKRIFDLLRRKFKDVFMCDMNLLSDIFNGEVIEYGSYDVVVCTWALVEGCPNKNCFVNTVKQVNRMLKIGGSFCVSTEIMQSFWTPVKHSYKLQTLPISLNFYKATLHDSGFEIAEFIRSDAKPTEFHDSKSFAIFRAVKSQDIPAT